MAAAFVDLRERQKALNKLKQTEQEKQQNEPSKRKRFYDLKQINSEREKWIGQFTAHMDDNQTKVRQLEKIRQQLCERESITIDEVLAIVDTQLSDYKDQRAKFVQSQREINWSTRPTQRRPLKLKKAVTGPQNSAFCQLKSIENKM